MWKKRKDIEGVSASSMLELKAELYEREQQSAKRPRAPNARRATSRIVKRAPLDTKNRGVEARAARDLAQSQADAVNSIASLERKAALYNSAARRRRARHGRRAQFDRLGAQAVGSTGDVWWC
jgi:hypothetical protein